jgi:hypothetical protein
MQMTGTLFSLLWWAWMASAARSTAQSLTLWEYAEYVSGALVALGCIGEYIADFTKRYEGEANKGAKDRISKRSTYC